MRDQSKGSRPRHQGCHKCSAPPPGVVLTPPPPGLPEGSLSRTFPAANNGVPHMQMWKSLSGGGGGLLPSLVNSPPPQQSGCSPTAACCDLCLLRQQFHLELCSWVHCPIPSFFFFYPPLHWKQINDSRVFVRSDQYLVMKAVLQFAAKVSLSV